MCPSVSAKRTLVVSMSSRQTRLPLVRQRVNYSDGGSGESWIVDSSGATVGRSGSSLRQWSVSVKHWSLTLKGTNIRVKH